MKILKLQLLSSKFEDIKMLKDENSNDLYAKLNDILNFRFNIHEKMEDSRIVRKILILLPGSFCARLVPLKNIRTRMQLRLKNSSVLCKLMNHHFLKLEELSLLLKNCESRSRKFF